MPESRLHEDLCALLRALLRHAFEKEHCVGGDQFIYWDAADPRQCIAPDAFVRLGQPDDRFKTWKVWERGAPELAIEILSEEGADAIEQKVAKYVHVGVRELVAFDGESQPPRLRVWDRVQGDMLEREPGIGASTVLPGYWVVTDHAKYGPTLRLARDAAGVQLYPTPAEAEAEARRAEAEARRAEAEARRAEAEGRQRAEQRIRELEEELRRRQG
ncbi:MAG: Uma2 family endonuclease [Myxococcales bacterium]|nr:MAG: Uma2 family endonuclease [Myxococcales bacterium]